MIGCGSYGQVIAATRKEDNAPVRTGNKLKIIFIIIFIISHNASQDGGSVDSGVRKINCTIKDARNPTRNSMDFNSKKIMLG